ncbi:VOC family protein [Aeromicrobium sp.]|uniref:VOC family protein n=1 Tax=Aeromicrobium sp. TaxID=1871063 RepID=UPI0025C63506|nr:VOC family protein [Aeromicrobium sp.]MCK5892751.1 VOC family protein [Aeromicrobium sp.]
MSLSISKCFVQVTDVDSAVAFYRDALGLEVQLDVPNDGFRWVTVVPPAQPDVAVILTNYVDGSEADRSNVAGLVTKGAFGGVHFRADDLEATFARLVEHGAEVVDEPADQPWGVRDGSVRDPSGNLIRIDQA